MKAMMFLVENYEIIIGLSIIVIGVLYFFRDKFVFEEQKNDVT